LRRNRVISSSAAKRLVHQQELGLGDERTRNRGPHLHAAGKLARVGLCKTGEADKVERGADLRPHVRLEPEQQPQWQPHNWPRPWPTASGSAPGTRSRSGARRQPATNSTAPLSGALKPATMRSAVDLPQPEGPSRVRNSPGRTARSRPSSATTPLANVLRTSRSPTKGAWSESTGSGLVIAEADHSTAALSLSAFANPGIRQPPPRPPEQRQVRSQRTIQQFYPIQTRIARPRGGPPARCSGACM